jgi:hypothetical protein
VLTRGQGRIVNVDNTTDANLNPSAKERVFEGQFRACRPPSMVEGDTTRSLCLTVASLTGFTLWDDRMMTGVVS